MRLHAQHNPRASTRACTKARETSTFNDANELLTRDTDSDSTVDVTLGYNKRGDMTVAGNNRTLVYDAFGRLRKVNRTDNGNPIAEYTYNGLGFRTGWKYDTDADGDTDGSDLTYRFAYDERWRVVATYRGSDSDPKEQYVFHGAGAGGFGGSSYIDAVVLRDKDVRGAWTAAASGHLEQRYYLPQNWRADVVAVLRHDGSGVVEWVRYLAYGTPVNVARSDANYDGTVNSTDTSVFLTLWAAAQTTYDVLADVDLDGDCDSTDYNTLIADVGLAPVTGYDRLSRNDSTTSVENRIGYAGYQWDPIVKMHHVRHRLLDPHSGRWTRRDPLGYVDGMGLYEYAASLALGAVDSTGLAASAPIPVGCPPVQAACTGTPCAIVTFRRIHFDGRTGTGTGRIEVLRGDFFFCSDALLDHLEQLNPCPCPDSLSCAQPCGCHIPLDAQPSTDRVDCGVIPAGTFRSNGCVVRYPRLVVYSLCDVCRGVCVPPVICKM